MGFPITSIPPISHRVVSQLDGLDATTTPYEVFLKVKDAVSERNLEEATQIYQDALNRGIFAETLDLHQPPQNNS